MCDLPKRKSSRYGHGRNTFRTVPTTKWELPIPSSKPYWDKICDDLEHRKEYVSDSPYPPSPSPDKITDPYVILNSQESEFSKSNYVTEPIVKIYPPTPMRILPQIHEFKITDNPMVNESDAGYKNDNHVCTDLSLSNNFSPFHVSEKKNAKLYKMSLRMTDLMKNKSVQTKNPCQLHKNAPPLKIFDDNLKRFLPDRKLRKVSPNTNMQLISPPNVLDLTKLHRRNSCPLRSQPVSKDRIPFDINLTANKNQNLPKMKRCKTESSDKIEVRNISDKFSKVPEPTNVNFRSNSKFEPLNKKSKSQILVSNVTDMLNISKLNDVSVDQNFFELSENRINQKAIANLDSRQQSQVISNEHNAHAKFSHSHELDASNSESVNSHNAESDEKLQECSMNEDMMQKKTENLPLLGNSANLSWLSKESSMASNEQMNENKQGLNENRISSGKLQDHLKKDFLKVPKLSAISSYPSFGKVTSGDGVDVEDSKKSAYQGPTEVITSPNPTQQTELCRKGFLKVPKLSMISSYPSFNSLIPDSPDSDDNATGTSELLSKCISHETSSSMLVTSNLGLTQDIPIAADEFTPMIRSNEKSTDYNEDSDSIKARNKEASPSMNSLQTVNPKRRHSLKDSVRYAYKALKFITSNKNLDFQPQSYHPPQKPCLSTESSNGSCDSKFSKFEPAIKLLTYEDISEQRSPIRSVSSSTYATVRSRLKQSASQYLGSHFIFPSSKDRPATSSTSIPSLTRSTSGPTLDFQDPVLGRPSDKYLTKLPKMSIFPRRKYDKCFACLHNAFEKPVKIKRELPVTILNAVVAQTGPILSESESSSISLPDMEEHVKSLSDYEDNWAEAVKSGRISSLLDKTTWKSSKGLLGANLDSYRSRSPLARTSDESQSLKSDAKIENVQKNVSSRDSITTNTHSKPLSLSSEHSKPSSLSGHSSESEEPQVQIKQALPSSECFASPYAPSHWTPSLEPLKSLKFRKPVSMHGRAVSITKTEDDSASDDNANNYRSNRKETKLNNGPTRIMADRNQDGSYVDLTLKPPMTLEEKTNLARQPSVISKIATSQLPAVANLTKKQSRVDLLSNNSKIENRTSPAPDVTVEIVKEIPKELQKLEAGLQDEKPNILESEYEKQTANLTTNLHSADDSKKRYVEAQFAGRSMTKSPLSQITEQLSQNESLKNEEGIENLIVDKSTEIPLLSKDDRLVTTVSPSTEFYKHEFHTKDSEGHTTKKLMNLNADQKVIEILEKCINENRTPFEMLEALSAVVSQNSPFTSKDTINNPKIFRSAKIATNLMRLLIESKKYLNPNTFSPHRQFSSKQTPLCNPRQLRRVLPNKTYNLVARILGIPENYINKSIDRKHDFNSGHPANYPFRLGEFRNKGPTTDSCDMIVHPPSPRGSRRPMADKEDFEYPQQSPYALFMDKPRRKAINWRPLTERDMLGYDPEATLNMRATRMTNKICEDFCHWLRGLGGGHGDDIDEEVLKDMFQIEFTAEACRTMQIIIKEIPMVPIAVALARNTPGAGELALTRTHLIRDAKAENAPKKTIGFGSMLPQTRRFLPPKNRVGERWLQCKNVPQDLEAMEAVWKGITHLDSVKGFLTWVEAHPEVKLPKILTETYDRKEILSGQPSTDETAGHIELEIGKIENLKVGDEE